MPKQDFAIITIVQTLENDTFLAESLFFSEVSRFGDDLKRVLEAGRLNAAAIVESQRLSELYQRRLGDLPVVSEIVIEIEPPSRSPFWRSPVGMRFHTLNWRHGAETVIVYVPVLGIEIVIKENEATEKIIADEIRAHLLRTKAATTLGRLLWLQRTTGISLERQTFTANVLTPKQVAMKRAGSAEQRSSVLEEVAVDLTKERLPRAFEIDDTVERIAEALTARSPRSLLLVGPSGVGKTAAVYELVRRREQFRLGHTPFWSTSGSRLVAGMSGYGMWQERCQRLWQEASKQKAVLYFGNLFELMEVGKSISNSQGIAGYFRPYLSRGDLLAIVECTPEQLPLIEKEDHHLLEIFLHINVDEPGLEKGRAILLNCALAGRGVKDAIDLEAIEKIDQLHRRYVVYSAYPGKPVRFMKRMLEDRADDETITAAQVIKTFSRETGLPLFMLSEELPLDLDFTRRFFQERVIGQREAIDLIVNLLATVKAGLTRPRKPIVSLLFIGPTGVGKTEMAKTLAEFLFQDRNRMVRFDMSEFADAIAVKRLVGGIFGSEGLLTAKVREQPFAVILLDELEKAHPLFFDLLLQILGEGRLTDAAGRVADFCNSVVIMTSNLGAESFQRGQIGFQEDDSGAAGHFVREVRDFMRPELFNRIDRIVPFSSLDEAMVLKIAERELTRLKTRDGVLYRGVNLSISPATDAFLARKGFHHRYGARPLKRAIERELLVPLAEALNNFTDEVALEGEARIDAERLIVEVKARLDESGKRISATVANTHLAELARRNANLRRELQQLERGAPVMDLTNEIFRLERLEQKYRQRSYKKPEDLEKLAQLPKLKRTADTIKALSKRVNDLEDNLLLSLYGKSLCHKDQAYEELKQAIALRDEILLAIYALKFKKPDYISLAIFSEFNGLIFEMARAYYKIAVKCEAKIELFQISYGKSEGKTALVRQIVNRPAEYLGAQHEQAVGLVLGITAPFVFPRLSPEHGNHVFIENDSTKKCLILTSEVSAGNYVPPDGITRRGGIASYKSRRHYNHDQNYAEDLDLKKRYVLGRTIDDVVEMVVEERLRLDTEDYCLG